MRLKPFHFFFLFTAIIGIWVSSNIAWSKDRWKGILESDARGYYAYLPAVFIYGDLNFTFFDSIENKKYYDEHYTYEYRVPADGTTINKYWCGTAICELPFFLAAHGLSKASGEDADGYSKYYNIFINLAGIFYLLFGLVYCDKLLSRYGISEWNRVMAGIAIVFGTNLFYYSAVEPGMSHVYSFGVIAFFLYTFQKMREGIIVRRLVVCAATLGLIFLIRPQNLLILPAVLILFDSRLQFSLFLYRIFNRAWIIAVPLLIFVAIGSIQFMIYKISSGNFFVDSYPGEKFNFSDPHMIDILFSYKKGLFLYTPMYLLCLTGLIYLWKKSNWQASVFFLHFLLITYVFSSWHNWWYGGSFSSRVYVEYLPLFMFPLAFMLQHASAKARKAVITAGLLLVVLCEIQMYQYRYNLIHWDSMTKEKYWDVFLRLDKI